MGPLAKENHRGAGTRLNGRGKEPVLEGTEKGETHCRKRREKAGRSKAGKRLRLPHPEESQGPGAPGLRFRGNGGRRKTEAGGLAGRRLGAGWRRLAVSQQQHTPP